ncbi:MAG: RluA family pseudouridine synthase [Treponema sp.]|nr:RluA family pseudouridine synthase [Treponema sp.]
MPSRSCIVPVSIPPGIRLDRYIAEYLKILSRSQIRARGLEVMVNGRAAKISRILKGGESLDLSWSEAEISFLVPEDLPLDILYEDDRVIVVNKAQGMVVHPGAGNPGGTLANALLFRRLQRLGAGSAEGAGAPGARESGLRPGIVHRLDKDTSGVIIAAWDEEAHALLSEQFKTRKVRKTYAALVRGWPKEAEGCIDKKIVRSSRDRKLFTVSDEKGRQSITYYKVVRSYSSKAFGVFSLLLIRPITGRTHQIRVHLKHLGHPILGDPLYGEGSQVRVKGLMLHAKRLSLRLPSGEYRTFRTRLPKRFTLNL